MKNKYLKTVKPKHKYREFLKVLNGLIQLSERERDILSLLVEIDDTWPETFEDKNVTSTDSRRRVMSATQVNKNNLSKYITLFKDKGILSMNGEGWVVNDLFKPAIDEDNKISVTFILDIEDENTKKSME